MWVSAQLEQMADEKNNSTESELKVYGYTKFYFLVDRQM